MKQLACIVLVFSSFHLFADPGHGLAANYNGRTLPCTDYKNAKFQMKKFGDASSHYNWALCQGHRGELSGAIASFETAAKMGRPLAAIALAEHYALEDGKFTGNLPHLQKGIDYYKIAFNYMSQPGYPSDPDSFQHEKKEGFLLLTANNLVEIHWEQFARRIDNHMAGSTSRRDNSTLESLKNVKAAAVRCLNIKYDSELWTKATYNKRMALCQAAINVLRDKPSGEKGILSLEEDRIDIAVNDCNSSEPLYHCAKHEDIANKLLDLYFANADVSNDLLASR